jgi:hypothetical protein
LKGLDLPNPLHFLEQKNKQTGVIVDHRSERGAERNLGLDSAAEELLRAIEGKDVGRISDALSNAFQLLESMPHEEAEEEESE